MATRQESAEWLSRQIQHGIARTALFGVLWFGLTEGEVQSWIVGGPAVVVAVAASLWLRPASVHQWRWRGVVRFAWFFLESSLVSGVDVARRAMAPGDLRLAPGFRVYPIRLPPGTPQFIFANTVSLLPGTLTAEFHPDRILVHALDIGQPFEVQLRKLESAVAALYGLEIPANPDAGAGPQAYVREAQ